MKHSMIKWNRVGKGKKLRKKNEEILWEEWEIEVDLIDLNRKTLKCSNSE